MYLILGGIIGLFTFVPFMQYMISEYIDNTMAILAGLMCGSLITLWPWKTDYDVDGLSPNLGLSQVFDDFALVSIILTFIFFMGGIAASFGLKQLEVIQRLGNNYIVMVVFLKLLSIWLRWLNLLKITY